MYTGVSRESLLIIERPNYFPFGLLSVMRSFSLISSRLLGCRLQSFAFSLSSANQKCDNDTQMRSKTSTSFGWSFVSVWILSQTTKWIRMFCCPEVDIWPSAPEYSSLLRFLPWTGQGSVCVVTLLFPLYSGSLVWFIWSFCLISF